MTEDVRGVELDGVSVSFGDVTAVDDVSLSVEDGEFFTLVGPSGCGKTTTLRAIAGLESLQSGTIAIGGQDVTDLPPEDRPTGIVFQNYALFSHMTVRANVAYGLQFADPPGTVTARERVNELLDMVDMTGMGERSPSNLSGGQKQRVALARALAPGPDVLLLDEPLSALDAQLRQRLRVTLREIQRKLGITTLYVTHNQAEALAISDRVAVVDSGQIEQVGTPEEIYRNPRTRFVAEFVGDNNLLDAEISSTSSPTATVGDVAFALPEDVSVTSGETVTLSIRPEAITLRPEAAEGTIEATVETVEFLGDAYRVHCEWGGHSLVVKTDAESVPEGTVRLGIDRSAVHVL
jgi:thiamine transport system ATP-binding protein